MTPPLPTGTPGKWWKTRAIGLADYGFLVLIHSLALMGSRLSHLQSWRTLIQFGSDAFHAGQYALFRKVVFSSIRLDAVSAFIALLISMVPMELYAILAFLLNALWLPRALRAGKA